MTDKQKHETYFELLKRVFRVNPDNRILLVNVVEDWKRLEKFFVFVDSNLPLEKGEGFSQSFFNMKHTISLIEELNK